MQTQSRCSPVVQTRSQTSRAQVGTEVCLPWKHGLCTSDCNCRSEIIVHNSGRRTHIAKIGGAHQGKISGLCWADDHRVLSCGVDKNIKMWDVRLEAPLDSSGPSQVHIFFFYLGRSLNMIFLQPKPVAVFPGKGTLQSDLIHLFVSLPLIMHIS
jgi:hypothetical protein